MRRCMPIVRMGTTARALPSPCGSPTCSINTLSIALIGLRRWERGEEEHWQAELWRRLATGTLAHRVRLHERLLTCPPDGASGTGGTARPDIAHRYPDDATPVPGRVRTPGRMYRCAVVAPGSLPNSLEATLADRESDPHT